MFSTINKPQLPSPIYQNHDIPTIYLKTTSTFKFQHYVTIQQQQNIHKHKS